MSEPEVVALVGNPRPGSRTRALADALAGALQRERSEAGWATLDLAEIAAVTFGREPAMPQTPMDNPHGTVRSARLLIVATPTYKGTYSGLLKVFLDQYGHRELETVVAVPVSISASPAHRTSVAGALTDLLGELGATVPAPPLSILEPEAVDLESAAAEWVRAHAARVVAALGRSAEEPPGRE